MTKNQTQPLTLYGLNRCGTCVKARQWLTARGIAHTFVDYRDQPVPVQQLTDWARQLGGWEKLVNRASLTWRNLPEARRAAASDADWTALIADAPTLVRRPVVLAANGSVAVGFHEARWQARFG